MERRIPYSLYKTGYEQFPACEYDQKTKTILVDLPKMKRRVCPKDWKRIAAGELVDHYFTSEYPRIGEALVLVFSPPPFLRPIRPHRWPDYVDILAE